MRNWLTRDPIGERGGLNLYEAMRNNPANYVDLLGLLTAVFIGGPSSLPGQLPNPFGHATIAFSGQGTYSFGTVEHFASSFPTLNDQAAYRGGTVYVLNTTPQQEQAMLDYLNSQKKNPINKYPDNCANRTTSALSAGGINLTQTVPAAPTVAIPMVVPINGSLPDDIGAALNLNPDVLQISIPEGTKLPSNFLMGFNHK
jgi:hypothetical protein